MPPRDSQLRIDDILQAIAKIRRYTEGMSPAEFAADDKTIDAVVRNISVIGEAARSIGRETASRFAHIPWADMRDMRNVVVHEYFGVDTSILWETVEHDLPPLAEMLVELKGQL